VTGERSAIKQSLGRFGVDEQYLTNAAELQITMAQVCKTGEGGAAHLVTK